MSEEEDVCLDDIEQLTDLLNKSSDTTHMLNLLAPAIDIHPNDGKGTKLLKLYLRTITDGFTKLSNDFRSLIQYMNAKDLLNLDNVDAPSFQSVPSDTLYL